jgi:hypothetical protein
MKKLSSNSSPGPQRLRSMRKQAETKESSSRGELAPSSSDGGVRAHFAGCARRCGRPPAGAVDVLADVDGYLVDGVRVPAGRLASALAEKGAQH